MERALRFLKRTSVNCSGVEDGDGVVVDDKGVVALCGEAVAEATGPGGAVGEIFGSAD